MTREKIIVTWDDVNSPEVDKRLREQEAKHRDDAFTSPALSMGAKQLRTQQRTSIWYNTVFAMAFFGLLGGLLAWGAGELINLKPLTQPQYLAQLAEAQDQWEAVQGVQRRYAAGIDRDTAAMQIRAIQDAARNNPYFQILRNRELTHDQQVVEIARQHGAYDTQAFIAKVLAYGLVGMIIAMVSLAPTTPPRWHKAGATINLILLLAAVLLASTLKYVRDSAMRNKANGLPVTTRHHDRAPATAPTTAPTTEPTTP